MVRIRSRTVVHDDSPGAAIRWEVAPVDEPGVVELLIFAVGEDGDRVDQVVQRYRDDSSAVLLVARSGQDPVAVLGFTVTPDQVTMLHIATAPHARRSGIATALLAELRRQTDRKLPIVAETDHDAVGFYRASGFAITPLGEKYPGVERFQAIWHSAIGDHNSI